MPWHAFDWSRSALTRDSSCKIGLGAAPGRDSDAQVNVLFEGREKEDVM